MELESFELLESNDELELVELVDPQLDEVDVDRDVYELDELDEVDGV